MGKPRKTASIAQMLFDLNQRNIHSTCSAEVRQGWNSMLSSILMAADVYSGYGYIGTSDLPAGEKPGIKFQNDFGIELTAREYYDRLASDRRATEVGNTPQYPRDHKTFPDETRRTYHIHAHIITEYRFIAAKHEQKLAREALLCESSS